MKDCISFYLNRQIGHDSDWLFPLLLREILGKKIAGLYSSGSLG